MYLRSQKTRFLLARLLVGAYDKTAPQFLFEEFP